MSIGVQSLDKALAKLPKLQNKLINGGFNFWQRGTSFVAPANGAYCADRWQQRKGGTLVANVSRSTDVPSTALSVYSLLVDITTAEASLAAGSSLRIVQQFEGNVLRTFKNKKMVLRFWVKSSKVGTYCVQFANNVAATRTFIREYTISQANTWEQKTVRLQHDSTGAWGYDSGLGGIVSFTLAAGTSLHVAPNIWGTDNDISSSSQVNFADTIGNTFRITDICLSEDNEAQTSEPIFQYAGGDYAEELALCQRYYQKSYFHDIDPGTSTAFGQVVGLGRTTATTTIGDAMVYFETQMRTTPTVVLYPRDGSPTGSWGVNQTGTGLGETVCTNVAFVTFFKVSTAAAAGLTVGDAGILSGHYTADAEL